MVDDSAESDGDDEEEEEDVERVRLLFELPCVGNSKASLACTLTLCATTT